MRRNGPLVELSTVPEVRRKMVVGNAGLLITAWVWILGYEAVDQTALSITFFMAGLHSDAETEVEMAYTWKSSFKLKIITCEGAKPAITQLIRELNLMNEHN